MFSTALSIVRVAAAAAIIAFIVGCGSTAEERATHSERADNLLEIGSEWRAAALTERANGNEGEAVKLEEFATAADIAAGLSQGFADEDPAAGIMGLAEALGTAIPPPYNVIFTGLAGFGVNEYRRREETKLNQILVSTIDASGGPSLKLGTALSKVMSVRQKSRVGRIQKKNAIADIKKNGHIAAETSTPS